MHDNPTSPSDVTTIAIGDLELGMQELEAMDAPDFWTGFKIGVKISSAAVASASLAVAIT